MLDKLIKAIFAVAVVASVGCHEGSTTRIKTSDGVTSQTIEYSGKVIFNKDQTGVEFISDGGHLSFEQDGKRVEVEPGKNAALIYEFDGEEVTAPDAEQQQFLKKAVQTIIQKRAKAQRANN